MNGPLDGRVALVTGASRGIGAAVARRLAADGATVLVHFASGRDRAAAVVREIEDAGGRAAAVGADLATVDGAAVLMQAVDAAFEGRHADRLDILVNNAGDFAFGSLVDTSDEAFDTLFNLNVRSVFQLARAAARRMTQARWGRIVNMGSVFGEAAPSAGMGVYCGTKFAVQGFTRAWSRDLGPHGITVNNVQPALIQREPPPTSGPAVEALKRFVSVGRFGTATDVAELVAFLAGPHAAFINGESINVDGGWGA